MVVFLFCIIFAGTVCYTASAIQHTHTRASAEFFFFISRHLIYLFISWFNSGRCSTHFYIHKRTLGYKYKTRASRYVYVRAYVRVYASIVNILTICLIRICAATTMTATTTAAYRNREQRAATLVSINFCKTNAQWSFSIHYSAPIHTFTNQQHAAAAAVAFSVLAHSCADAESSEMKWIGREKKITHTIRTQ